MQVLGPGAGVHLFLDGEIQAGDRHCQQHKGIGVCFGGDELRRLSCSVPVGLRSFFMV